MTNSIVLAIVTAYTSTHTAICANGHHPSCNYTIAAPRNIPLGTHIRVEGFTNDFVVEDRTNIRFNGRFDIYMSSKKDCIKWGKQKRKITIITEKK